ncbi:dynamin family protein [Sorangium atrum]|uniref:Dynamin family protein n=1 Tax=Sorangium atrum TaxID=2995308 RepID=A0ABT5C630_9BACT|nr:dynamin family protein [Sorangium aterium]MDC0681860.1 dynamin family protein [Sorangium aterium]
MARLVEALNRFFGRVEILALGLENERSAAEAALAKGMPLEAREHARTILSVLPDSAVGLALWADAAEDAWLDQEVVAALTDLAKRVPWRADVWLRLGRAGQRVGWDGARDAIERATSAPEERDAARLALLDLSDLDLAAGDPARAQRWLDRIPAPLTTVPDRDVALRRAECALAYGDLDGARAAAEILGEPTAIEGRAALVLARLALAEASAAAASSAAGSSAALPPAVVGRALDLGLRALVLDVPGAAELCAALVAASRDVLVVDRVRRVVRAAGALDEPTWAAAFAFAEGRRDDARQALARGLSAGDSAAAAALLRMAVETRDLGALDALVARGEAKAKAKDAGEEPRGAAAPPLPPDLVRLRDAAAMASAGQGSGALDALDAVTGEGAAWADDMRRAIAQAWVPPADGPAGARAAAAWSDVLRELARTAKLLDRLDLLAAIEALAVERERPLRAAVVGEFNAGKSTFLNALLGEDVAPTGVLPTTATLHWVAWAPDPFARIVVRGGQDRVVPHAALKDTLRALAAAGDKVARVFIYAPIERLKRVEILDTPGFNAPDPDHIAEARRAFDEAHVAIWLLDAPQAMKESERRVLSEISALGVPVQILANKADRLKPDALETVLAHVRDSLAASSIASLTPPIAFSARLSLKGRLGDEAALAASGWAEVEALFAEQIVDASDALRERALRRKAGRIAAELAQTASARAAEDREAGRRARAEADRLRASAAYLRRERRALAAAIDKALEPARRELASDLRPIAALPEERKRTDASVRAYVQERLVARLSWPLSAEIARAARAGAEPAARGARGASGADEGGAAPSPRAAAHVRAVLMGMVAVHDAPDELAARPIEGVVEAAIDAFAMALSAEAEAPVPPPASAAVELRAQALRAAFEARVTTASA